MTNASAMCDFFSQLTAFRKRFAELQPKVADLFHLPYQKAGGQMKRSEFHGRLHTAHGVRLVAGCLA